MANQEIKQAAVEIIDAAGAAGGRDEVARIAERGWPVDVELRGYDHLDAGKLRAAVQDLAKRTIAD